MQAKQNLRVVKLVVKKVVEDATPVEGQATPEQTRQLEKYIGNSQTADVVYAQLLARAGSQSMTSHQIVTTCNILKKYLPLHRPSPDVLKQVETFCVNAASSTDKDVTGAASEVTSSISGGGAQEQAPRRPMSSSFAPGRTPSISSSTLRSTTGARLVADMLYVKPPPPGMPVKHRPMSLLTCGLFGGHLRRAPASMFGDDSKCVIGIDVSDALHITVPETYRRHITAVGMDRKHELEDMYRERGELTVRRKGYQGQLDQYKPYSEQSGLSLEDDELNMVFDETLQSSDDPPRRVTASKIVNKLMMDLYAAKDTQASLQLLSFFLEMLDSHAAETRIHAFNLLFNTSVHVHMYDTFDHLHRGRSKTCPSDAIQLDLFMKLKEMLLVILQKDERDQRVWCSAFNALVYFITANGHIDKERLFSLDPRLFLVFLRELSGLGDDVTRKLIRMLVNVLYATKSGILNVELLHHVGGIDAFVQHYISTRSLEVRHNLFRVLFDYVVAQMIQRRHVAPEPSQVAIIFELLKRFDVPRLLPQVYKYTPDNFVETLVRYMFFDQLKRDASFAELSAKLDKTLIVAFLYDLEKQALQYWQLQPEFDVIFKRSLQNTSLSTDTIRVLSALLESDVESDRRSGESWLFNLLKAVLNNKCRIPLKELLSFTKKLAKAPQESTRIIYVDIVEKMFLVRVTKLSTLSWDDNSVGQVFALLNSDLMEVLLQDEQDPHVLMRVFDVIFDAISVRPLMVPVNPYIEGETDTNYTLLLEGHARLPHYLLQKIDARLLAHLFDNLPVKTYGDARVAVLLLLVERCLRDTAVLNDVCGGSSFFKALLEDKDPKIAFHAARYLQLHMQRDNPVQYRDMLAQLVTAAREKGDESMLQNPYMMAKAMLANK